ncbi:hypothetical protein Vretimale_7820 [Volvox reticuliferus]|uniref:N-acetylglucosaminylphosphatidylinositol deacetylase n=1 Tax=Volvox reticuliferus TaxID=1737510 RepID=A0A8J4GA64_9CHLO|nr:hypothetical protein Vretifemale_4910 [Volvox reticuliferus]GIM03011.1 hypothetical protein Vretimale_7820 [Volvox reticuliferus]
MVSLVIGLLAIFFAWCFRHVRSHLASSRAGQRALLVVAHPDDESLFFASYIANAAHAGMEVHILCLSTGNADGFGHIRVAEMRQACATLKVPMSRLIIADDPKLQDGFHSWRADDICNHLAAAFKSIQPDELVTFDSGGVSGHPNHTSIYHAVRRFITEMRAGGDSCHSSGGGGNRCRVYTLVTHPLLLKFTGPLGVLVLLVASRLASGSGGVVLLARDPSLSFRAMICHWSQLVWYRLLFVLFSTYTYVNQLHLIGDLPLENRIGQ